MSCPTFHLDSFELPHDFQQYGILISVDSVEPVQPPFKLWNSKWGADSSLKVIEYIRATSKGSDQTAHMRRLVWAIAGRTYPIVGNPMPRLNFEFNNEHCYEVLNIAGKYIISCERW